MRKSKKLAEATLTVKQRDRRHIKKAILAGTKKPITLVDLARKIDAPMGLIEECIDVLKKEHHTLFIREGVLSSAQPPHGKVSHFHKLFKGGSIKVGVISDNQLGNQSARLDVLHTAYDHYKAEGISVVYNAGNIIDGYSRFNMFELLREAGISLESQTQYAAANYPKREGITTFFITGDCFSGDTEILVKGKGFVRFDALLGGDAPPEGVEVATLKLDTGSFEWQTPTGYWKRELKPTERMFRFVNQKVDLLVTEGHNIISRARATTMESAGPWEVTRAGDWEPGTQRQMIKGCWGHQGSQTEKLHGFDTVLWARFMGWYLSEGHAENSGRISISQEPSSAYYVEIGELLAAMEFKAVEHKKGWRFRDLELASYLRKFGRSWEKYVPEDIKNLSPQIIKEFLVAYWKGDGNIGNGQGYRKSGHLMCASTSSSRMADDLVELLVKVGYGAKTKKLDREPGQLFPGGARAKTRRPEYRIYASRNIFVHYREVPTIEAYSGHVYCLGVPNGIVLLRRNGKVYYSSQCHEGWYMKESGLNVGAHMESRFRVPLLCQTLLPGTDKRQCGKWIQGGICQRHGRKDLRYIGHIEADIGLFPGRGAKGTVLRLMHPGGGTAYAHSYKPQKYVESLSSGEKPAITVQGHYHKAGMFMDREVYVYMAGTTESQSIFMRKHQIVAHVGYWILDIKLDSSGVVSSCRGEFVRFYDEGYYKTWEHSGVR